MKISFDIDCTPDELRGFFGMPDVTPMQERLLKEIEERMRADLKALDPETMLKTWLPAGLKGFEQLQEMFLGQLGQMITECRSCLIACRWKDCSRQDFPASQYFFFL